VAFALTAAGAALAVALELLEGLAIVLAVAVSRRAREAVLGAVAACAACGALAVLAGPVLLARVEGSGLSLVVGIALLLFGMEWLRKGVLRLAGRRARSSSYAEFVEEQEALESVPGVEADRFDWAGFAVAFKGVALEGVEVILIVTALGARPGGLAPAVVGAGAAFAIVVAIGVVLHRPLRALPETELKYVVGLVLTTFGTFFAAEGLGVSWPLGEAALLVVLVAWLVFSQALTFVLARGAGPRPAAAATVAS
jgi:uncharacterized membrane protein